MSALAGINVVGDKSDVDSSKKSKKRRRSRSRSPSSASSSSSESDSESGSDSSSSDSDDRHKKKRKKKKKKKHKSKKSKKHKKHKKHKKAKKSKKSKGDKKVKPLKDKDGNTLPEGFGEWGFYGTIRADDIHTKADEFYAWLLEVKHTPREALSRKEEMRVFAEFQEDYNTATFKDTKFYDIAKWYAKQRADGTLAAVKNVVGRNDEETRQLELRAKRSQQSAAADEDRKRLLMAQLRQSKAGADGMYEQIRDKHASGGKSTFESIAKDRENQKKKQEKDAHDKYYGKRY
jgi:hypothetical protein